jgi:hypothetical protein
VELSPALVIPVVVAMVVRVLRNPDGKPQESLADYAYTRDAVSASGELTVTDDELELLAPIAGVTGAFTISPWYDPDWSATA